MKTNIYFWTLPAIIVFYLINPVSLQAQDYILRLNRAIKARGNVPLDIYLETDGNSILKGRATVHFMGGLVGGTENYSFDVSQLKLNDTQISGTFTIQELDKKDATYTIDATLSDQGISGSYTGKYGENTREGFISGKIHQDVDPERKELNAHLLLYRPFPPNFDLGYASKGVALSLFFQFESGVLKELEVRHGGAKMIYFGPNKNTQTYQFIGEDGGTYEIFAVDRYTFKVLKKSANITTNSFQSNVEVEWYDNNKLESVLEYKIEGEIIGNAVLATYEVSSNGKKIQSNRPCSGYIDLGSPLNSSPFTLSPLVQVSTQERNTFNPPYFEPSNDYYERIYSAAHWLSNSLELQPFRSDRILTVARGSGNKQYDNNPVVGYGGALGNILMANMVENQPLKKQLLEHAERAGYFLMMNQYGPYSLPQYYKQMFYLTSWMGLAFLELYEATDNEVWMEEAIKYADNLAKLQNLMNLNGTWTYLNEDNGEIGESNSRNNREYDNLPQHCAEFLYFLGKLRVQFGINDYQSVENKAYDWMKKNMEDVNYWEDRREHYPVKTSNAFSAVGPTFYMLYMLEYASEVDQQHLAQILSSTEDKLVKWGHRKEETEFLPRVNSFWPRMINNKSHNTAATARLAYVYLLMYQKTDIVEYQEKAYALFHSILASQNLKTGMIAYNGVNTYSNDHLTRINEGNYQHQYSILKAETINYLYKFYLQINESGPKEVPPVPSSLRVKAKTMLEGFLTDDGQTMKADLQRKAILPLAHPFGIAPFLHTEEVAVENIPESTVNWILLALHDPDDPSKIAYQKAGWINSQGFLVDTDGEEGILFTELKESPYYISIHAFSHLPVMSADPVPIIKDMPVYDFTTGLQKAKGVDQLKKIQQIYAQFAGDYDHNGNINSLDFNLWKQNGATLDQYLPIDGDGNGVINNLDFNLWNRNRSKIAIKEFQR